MTFPRASGILLHPTSLPSRFGIGDFGPIAFQFVDFLAEARQTYWQILPLGPTGYGDSPYQSYSAFAGNTNLISPEKLVESNLLTDEEINQKPDFPVDRVDYGKVYEWKNEILPKAFARFQQDNDSELKEKFEKFCAEEAAWLEDYALFRAAKLAREHKAWNEWENPLRLRQEKALKEARKNLHKQIEEQKFYQFLFFRQWFELKNYANEKGVQIAGDVPIFVALDSADVWCNQDKFKLKKDGSPRVVAGVPPDYFSKTGQLWGNPIYNWSEMRRNGFGWWISRIKHTLKTVDVARIDHFRGFAGAWEVPGGDETAENGKWVNVPGRELFKVIQKAIGELPFWAEDLGMITDDVRELRDRFGFPGMKILQYAFGGDPKNEFLPHNYERNSIVYTGTHDNETIVGWFQSRHGYERYFCLKYLGAHGYATHWDFIRAAWSSVADTAIAPMQDVLGLGNEARMNLPASSSGNWNWRFRAEAVTKETIEKLREMTEIYGRSG